MPDPTTVDDTFDPSTVEANRARDQGLGVGQKELDAQRDPTRIASAEPYGRTDGGVTGQDATPPNTPEIAPDPLGDDDLSNE